MQVANSISESAKPNWNKQIKFAYLQKLANQSMLNGVIMIKMTETSGVIFMEARKS